MRCREKMKISPHVTRIFFPLPAGYPDIEKRIAHPLPEDEVWFIYQYIISSGVVIEEHNDVSVIGHMHSSDEARLITHRLIAPCRDGRQRS